MRLGQWLLVISLVVFACYMTNWFRVASQLSAEYDKVNAIMDENLRLTKERRRLQEELLRWLREETATIKELRQSIGNERVVELLIN